MRVTSMYFCYNLWGSILLNNYYKAHHPFKYVTKYLYKILVKTIYNTNNKVLFTYIFTGF